MLLHSGYHSEYGDVELQTELPLLIVSCGHYKIITKDRFTTYRPNGRNDYQLLYVARGTAEFLVSGQKQIAKAGSAVLYRPNDTQWYSYSKEDSPDIYWVHFMGSSATQILESLMISHNKILTVGLDEELLSIFQKIIFELQMKRKNYAEYAIGCFMQLLSLISRHLNSDLPIYGGAVGEIEHAIGYFQTHYGEDIILSDYAAKRNMSLCWFTRLFKSQTGISPRKYITNLRLMRAKELLTTTKYSVKEIAELTGHQNQLYFCRIFKTYVGCTPTEYRMSL